MRLRLFLRRGRNVAGTHHSHAALESIEPLAFRENVYGVTATITFGELQKILLLKSDGSQMATVILTKDGHASGNKVQLQHNPTGADGTNSPDGDLLGISTHAHNKLGTTFCTPDWILKLAPITFRVDATDPTNPKLLRVRGGSALTVMDQVIGFKVGATLWNDGSSAVTEQYNYDTSTYSTPCDFTLVRSVRVSLIGRTPPSADPFYSFRNSFDDGPYQIQGVSIVVNPRNLSMRD